MNSLPDNNVYGFLYTDADLNLVADTLRSQLGLSDKEVFVYTSQYDGGQTLNIRTNHFEFETQKITPENTYLFNGAVAGDDDHVLATVQQISDCLLQKGYKTKFEIYDGNSKCIAEYP